MADRLITGAEGERVALEFLSRKGYKLVDRNYRKPWGEIDLILEKADVVHFVEVKAILRSKEDFSREKGYQPEELAHQTKLAKVARTAALYMEEKRDSREFQIDVIAVLLDPKTRSARCQMFEQALGE